MVSINPLKVRLLYYINLDFKRNVYLEKKFNIVKYDVKFISKCLQRDILDFQEYNKELIKRQKPMQEELLKLIQECINEVVKDYEVKCYIVII